MAILDFLKKKELEEISRLQGLLKKYQPIIDIDEEMQKQQKELELFIKSSIIQEEEIKNELKLLNQKYQSALSDYSRLENEINLGILSTINN